MSLLRKKSTPLLGVDISSTSVKLIELRRHDGRYRVESYAVEPLPPNSVVEKNIANLEAVSSTIKAAVKRSQTKLREAAVAVPGSAAISRTLTLDGSFSEEEMEDQIGLQADQYIPYPLEEVNLDFQVIGPAASGGNDVEVLLVASRSENVEIRVDALESAGLATRIVDVESYALESAFQLIAPDLPGGDEQTVAVIDVGATMTTLSVFEEGRIVYTRDQLFGGRQLTEEIMRRFGLSFEEAGRAKRQGGLPDNYEEEVLAPFRDSMAQQVSRSLQFFFGASQHDSVDHIVVAGGCASIPGAAELIEETAGVQTSVANPFGRMSVASRIKPQALAEDAPALMIPCGLALRSFD
ncbi:MAG TPA: pilus assembly protein PilM [Gammaproteobacteria bacterium]|nr:pilus assembly protein PilM [Gammaproteobacteria bacterium]